VDLKEIGVFMRNWTDLDMDYRRALMKAMELVCRALEIVHVSLLYTYLSVYCLMLQCKWSRKGFLRTRWSLGGTVFDLINIHLFHDASNFVAVESVSMFSIIVIITIIIIIIVSYLA
jgi:hypothetical protein